MIFSPQPPIPNPQPLTPLPLRYRLLHIEAVWVLLALWMPFAHATSAPIAGDTWWLLKAGQIIVESGHLYTEDLFNHTPHTPDFVNGQWLPQVAFFLSYRLLGPEGVALFGAVLITATFTFLLVLAWERCGSVRLAAICTLLAGFAAGSYLVPVRRAQTFGFLLFVLTYWLLTRPSHRAWTIAALMAVEAAWANSHGTFFFGPALTVVMLAGGGIEIALARGWRAIAGESRLRFLSVALVAQILATFANPYGPGIYLDAWRVSTHPIVRSLVSDWLPTTVREVEGYAFFLSVVVVVGAIVLSRRPLAPTDALMLIAFAGVGFQALRGLAFWSLAAAPILAAQLAQLPMPQQLAALSPTSAPRNRLVLNAILAGLLVLSAVSLLPWVKDANPWLPQGKRGMVHPDEPEAAASFLASQNLPSRMLNYQPWGAYLDWRLWPHYQTMVDISIEVHPPEVWIDYIWVSLGHATWQERLDKYGIGLLVLHREAQASLIELARASPRWREVYRDQLAVVFTLAA